LPDETPPIAEIEDRLQDLLEALDEVGLAKQAAGLERHADHFTDPRRVRPSVNAIREQVQRWRSDPAAVGGHPKVLLSANRVEDACIEALREGVIVAAPLSVAAQSRRKLKIALVTTLVGLAVLMVPFLLFEFGIDVTALGEAEPLPRVEVPRGELRGHRLRAALPALLPEAVSETVFEPLDECQREGAVCARVPDRLWGEVSRHTWELKRPGQAYGLLFAFGTAGIGAAERGEVEVLLEATPQTPTGRYRLPLMATYVGYTPQDCDWVARIRQACQPPRRGEGERHRAVAVPELQIDVTAGDPAKLLSAEQRAEAEAEAARERARARAQELLAVISDIEAQLDQTRKDMQRRRHEQARERIAKLAELFAPLSGVELTPAIDGGVPEQLQGVRDRYEDLRERLDGFEGRVFDRAFAVLAAPDARAADEAANMAKIGKRFGISAGYVEEIYLARADELQRRIEAREQAQKDELERKQAALEARCGSLPKGAWGSINDYLGKLHTGADIYLGECMTPRLMPDRCWELRCDYVRKLEITPEKPKVVTKHKAAFFLKNGKVTGHRGGHGPAER